MKAHVLFVAAAALLSPGLVLSDSLTVGNETITHTDGTYTYDSVTMNSGAKKQTARLIQSGGSLTVTGTTTMNGAAEGQVADLVICGDATGDIGTIDQNNSWTYGGAKSYFTISNNAVVSFGNYKGQAAPSAWAYLTVADNARLVQKDGTALTMPTAGSATAPYFTMTVRDNAYAELTAVTLYNSHGALRTEGHGQLVIRGNVNTYDTMVDMICAADDSTIVVRGNTELLSGGGILVQDRARFIQAGGYLDLGWNGSPSVYLAVSNQAAIVSTNLINVGRASDTDTPHVFIRLCDGGTLEFPGFQYGRTAYWANDTYKRSMTNLYCEGGVMRPMKANADFIRYWKYAQLVGAGLTVDTAGYATGVEQTFVGTTFTKVGLGTMTTRTNSLHQTTAVAKGTLLFGPLANTFGRTLVVTNGAMASLEGTATALSLSNLVLGDATGTGVLTLDAGDVVTVATAAGLQLTDASLSFGGADTDGTYDIFRVTSGTVTATQLAGLKVSNQVVGKKYLFTVTASGSGCVVRLTVSANVIVSDSWTGAANNAWRTTGNWSSGAYADELTIATFPSTATRKAVTVADADQAYQMVLEDSYAFSGAGTLATGSIEVNAGASTSSVRMDLTGELPVAAQAGAQLTLAGKLTGADAASVRKSGPGTLVLSGDNSGFAGSWNTSEGTLVFKGGSSPGTPDPTTAVSSFTGGTVTYDGGNQTFMSSIEVDPGATTSMIFNAQGSTTVEGGLDSKSGGIVVRGTGSLTLTYGATTAKLLAKHDLGREGQMPPSAAIAFPANGASPASSVLSSVSILSGELCVEGEGQASTRFTETARNHIVGGNWADAPASARWELRRVYFQAGDNDHWFVVGNCVSSPNATRPTLSVGADAWFESTCNYFGRENASFDGNVYPTLAVTNGTCASYFSTYLGADSVTSRLHPILRIGTGGVLNQRHGGRILGYGIILGHDVDAEVADGGSANSSAWGLMLTPAASGEFRVLNGGILNVSYISSRDAATTTDPFTFVFDGGVFSPNCNNTTSVHGADRRKIELRGAGLTYTQSSCDHTIAMRVTGTGGFVKQGTKKLTFAAKNECVKHTNESSELKHDDKVTLGESGYKTVDFTGTLDIQGGTVAIESGAARADLKAEVASGCTLDLCNGSAQNYVIGGAGTIKRAVGGTMTIMSATNAVPVLDAVTADLVYVDFSRWGDTLRRKQVVPVVQLQNGATVGTFRDYNCGAKIHAQFETSTTGLVTAKMISKRGLVTTIREYRP